MLYYTLFSDTQAFKTCFGWLDVTWSISVVPTDWHVSQNH